MSRQEYIEDRLVGDDDGVEHDLLLLDLDLQDQVEDGLGDLLQLADHVVGEAATLRAVDDG